MPISEHIITYNRYEPISNLIDLTIGNRNTKPATLKEIDNENLPTFKQKHDNKIPNCIYSTPNLQNINDPGPRQIKPQICPTLRKGIPKNKLRIVIVGDSFAKGISGELKRNLKYDLEVIGYVRLGSGIGRNNESGQTRDYCINEERYDNNLGRC